MSLKKLLFRVLIVLVSTPVLVLMFIYLNFHMISFFSHSRIYNNVADLPKRDMTLVMGAGNYEPDLWVNYAFNSRMEATFKLFSGDKTGKILVSGISVANEFSEPEEMKEKLIHYGIPDSVILTDSLGVRTWVSILRVKDYFKANHIIIVSQKGQLERALFIASCIGIDAVGLVASPNPTNYHFWIIREYLARVKCIADVVAYYLKIS